MKGKKNSKIPYFPRPFSIFYEVFAQRRYKENFYRSGKVVARYSRRKTEFKLGAFVVFRHVNYVENTKCGKTKSVIELSRSTRKLEQRWIRLFVTLAFITNTDRLGTLEQKKTPLQLIHRGGMEPSVLQHNNRSKAPPR